MRTSHKQLAAVGLGAMLLGISIGAYAQQQQQQQAFWYVTQYQVPFTRVDSLTRMLRTYTLPAVAEAVRSGGELLDEKWLVHHTGGNLTVMRLTRYRNWNAIEHDSSFEVAARRLQPDSVRRRQIIDAFRDILAPVPHTDGIYTEVLR